MFFKYINDIYNDNRVILKNFTYLQILQFARLIIPIILIPILVREVGLEKYGLIVFAQTLTLYFIMFLDFGFQMSGTKSIAINRENNEKLSEIFTSIFILKFIIFLISFSIFSLFVVLIPFMKQHYFLFLFSFLFSIQSLLVPVWFFQGLEKMKYITMIDVSSRLLFLLSIFIFINEPKDYILVPILRLICILILTLYVVYIVFFKQKLRLKAISFSNLKFHFKESLPFFFSHLSNVVNIRTNTILLGLFSSMSLVAYYDFVTRVVEAIASVIGTITKVLYPQISITKNLIKAKMILYLNLFISLAAYILLCFFSKQIIMLIFNDLNFQAHTLFYYLGFLLPLIAIEWTLGDLYLASFGYAKEYSLSSIYSTIFYLIIVTILFMFNFITLISLIFALVARFLFVSIYRYYYCKKYRLI